MEQREEELIRIYDYERIRHRFVVREIFDELTVCSIPETFADEQTQPMFVHSENCYNSFADPHCGLSER